MSTIGNLKKGAVARPRVTDPDDNARAIIAEGRQARTSGNDYLQHPVITPRGIQIAIATAIVESNLRVLANPADPDSENYPNDGQGYDSLSDGLFQQQPPWWGTAAERMDPCLSAAMFYNHLAKLDYNDPNSSPGTFAYQVQQCAPEYAGRYDQKFRDAVALYNRLTGPPHEGWNDMAVTPQQVLNMFNGTQTDGSPLLGPDGADYRRVDLLSPDTESIDEGPNTNRSIFDEVTTMAKILTQTHNGKTLFEMVAALYDKQSAASAAEPIKEAIKASTRKPQRRQPVS